jgi:hypothetical protein
MRQGWRRGQELEREEWNLSGTIWVRPPPEAPLAAVPEGAPSAPEEQDAAKAPSRLPPWALLLAERMGGGDSGGDLARQLDALLARLPPGRVVRVKLPCLSPFSLCIEWLEGGEEGALADGEEAPGAVLGADWPSYRAGRIL